MNALDIILIIALSLIAGFALWRTLKNRKKHCGGNCSCCGGSCEGRKG